jgi:hypothetical protein
MYKVLTKDCEGAMVNLIDNFLVKLDFNREELESVKTRHILYLGIAAVLLVNLIFVPLAFIEIAGLVAG